ncbi:hypothetical protein CPB83DRAFT_887458 [Crepidotus variabilis]|uniref:Uncharacterized protein n=1 Tax=Crepidotus variabilis TaxID=179855 RepID=A0A9P6E4W6_9AGAR|nr:hypothetical protein CPB83DRAFT_887458 [Crepidotus variabilis]
METTRSSPSWSSSYVHRIDSGSTDESGFSSNLVTPTDEQELFLPTDGIEARLLGPLGGIEKGNKDHTISDLNVEFGDHNDDPPLVKVRPYSRGVPKQLETMDKDADLSTMASQISMAALDSSVSMSSLPSASELLAQSRRRSSALYHLPNAHISVEDIEITNSEAEDASLIRFEDFIPSMNDMEPTPDLEFSLSWPADLRSHIENVDPRACAVAITQALLFLPWCILVGATIVLSPAHLDMIAFSDSCWAKFVDKPSSPIYRYAYLAQYGMEHVTIFCGIVFLIIWFLPYAGWLILGCLAAQFSWTWNDFLEDKNIALGEDERQTVYQLAKTAWWNGDVEETEFVNGKYYSQGSLGSEQNCR